MPRRTQKILPARGFCSYCNKDSYYDEIAAALALEALIKHPRRGAEPPIRFYTCPRNSRRFHLTSQPMVREISKSA